VEAAAGFSATVFDSPKNLSVGASGEATTNPWNGNIDEFRLSVGTARWTAAFIAPGKAYDTSACRGYFYVRKTDGSIAVFAATANRLFQLRATDLDWTDISGSDYAPLPTSYHWQFAQFGNLVVAVQPNVAPQVFDLSSSSAFAALGGSPPNAAYVSIVNRFVVLSGLTPNPFRIQWSGLGSATTWTPGVNASDLQDFPDGGVVRGAAGGEYGVIFQDSVIRRMIYQPGDPRVFIIEKVTEDKGLLAPYSIVKAGTQILFLAQQGFHAMGATGVPAPIGKEKFDRYFFANCDSPRCSSSSARPIPRRRAVTSRSSPRAAPPARSTASSATTTRSTARRCAPPLPASIWRASRRRGSRWKHSIRFRPASTR
jgi:hypothetical protein